MENDSPLSPDPVQESPESPEDAFEKGEILFVEDRRPGDVTVFHVSGESMNESKNEPGIRSSVNQMEENKNVSCELISEEVKTGNDPEIDSPRSPEQLDQGELLFVEDRRPGNVPFSNLGRQNEQKPEAELNFIRINCSEGDEEFVVLDEADNSEVINDVHESLIEDTEADDDLCFVIEDRDPLLTGQETQSPRYQINENFLKLQDGEKKPKRNKLSNTCFNCGESTHAIRDCPEPRNPQMIAKNRKQFMDSKNSMGGRPVYKRYHVEESQRFGHLVPGELSPELRRALGLGTQELPSHIYLMRRLGYPPGWLQEALVSHSGIHMFDGQGQEVEDPQTVPGERPQQGSLDKYDVRKIIHYPGFNTPPPPDTYDDSQYYRVPPLSQWQSVDALVERLSGRVVGGYKRKKLSLNRTATESDDTSQFQDMEYEEVSESVELPADNCKFVPPLPDEELPPPPPTDLPSEPTEMEATSIRELEEQKKMLLAELNDTAPLCGTPESKVGKVKSLDLGTPILKSVSPFARLPSAEKFSVNICDVINFENLPDSTGKYEQMSGLIKKVRVKLSEINDDS